MRFNHRHAPVLLYLWAAAANCLSQVSERTVFIAQLGRKARFITVSHLCTWIFLFNRLVEHFYTADRKISGGENCLITNGFFRFHIFQPKAPASAGLRFPSHFTNMGNNHYFRTVTELKMYLRDFIDSATRMFEPHKPVV